MESEGIDLVKVRVTAFLYEAGTLVATGIMAVIMSPEFSDLVSAHFGETVWGSLIVLVTTGIVKHIRNTKELGRAKRLGSIGIAEKVTLI